MEQELLKREAAKPKKDYDVVSRFKEVARRARNEKPAPKPEPPDATAYGTRPGAAMRDVFLSTDEMQKIPLEQRESHLRAKRAAKFADVNLPNEK